MPTNPADKTSRWWTDVLTAALPFMAAAYLGLFVLLAALRSSYPYELEWMEGSMAQHVQRVLDGQPLYVAPGVDFVPAIYTPLYYYLSAGAARLFGEGLFSLRLVSCIAALGNFALLYYLVRRETQRRIWGFFAAGLFAAAYRIGGAWYDIARPDSLSLFFLLASLIFLRRKPSALSQVLAGLLAAAAVLTKQSLLPVILTGAVYALLTDRARGWYFVLSAAAILAGAALFLQAQSGGWFWFYTVSLPSQHAWNALYVFWFWVGDLLLPVPVICVLAVVFWRLPQADKDQSRFLVLMLAGLIMAAYVARIKANGYDNVLIPAYLGLIIVATISAARLESLIREKIHLPAVTAAWRLILILPFIQLYYNPLRQLPTHADRIAGDRLRHAITEIAGAVYVPCHGYYAALAGKAGTAHSMAADDILSGKDERAKRFFQTSVDNALASRRFAAVITDDTLGENTLRAAGYAQRRPVFDNPKVFWPVTGNATRPEWIYVPCADTLQTTTTSP